MSNPLKDIQLEGESLIYKAYELGYREATKEVTEGTKLYEKGLEDAWECARKLIELSITERQKLFNTVSISDIINILSPSEAMSKVKRYEEGKHVVVTEENFRALCEALMAVREQECCTYDHDEAFDMAEHYMEQIEEGK